ncbi:hypothetical protein RCH13_001387 [Chryseobacterium sp. MP_3.2]|nr:hypothetical protein [Chryseobacterium sp. MP_3.2]
MNQFNTDNNKDFAFWDNHPGTIAAVAGWIVYVQMKKV